MDNRILDLYEKKYRLKYFYMVDIDSAINNIKETSAYKTYTDNPLVNLFKTKDLFLTLFCEIIQSSRLLSEYILAPGNPLHCTLFGEDINNIPIQNYNALSCISLFHHCIIYGFYKKFQESYNTLMPLNSVNLPNAKYGIYSPTTNEKDKVTSDKYLAQKDYSRNKRMEEKQSEYYSVKYLNNLMEPPKTKTGRIYRQTATYKAIFTYFLWSEPIVHPFDKSLLSKKDTGYTFLRKYCAIQDKYKSEWHDKLSKPDKILFDFYMEPAYCFNLFSYIATLLNDMNFAESTNEYTLKSLEGQAFLELLLYVMDLPITYNRGILLKYALKSVLSSENLTASYPQKFQDSFGKYESITQVSKEQFAGKAISSLSSYFHMLKYVTLPLLEDFWDVVTSNEFLKYSFTLEHYTKFITKYFTHITSDYTKLETSKKRNIKLIPDKKYQIKNNIKQKDLFKLIYDRFVSLNEENLPEQKLFENKYYPKILGEDLKNILQKYCTSIHTSFSSQSLLHTLFSNDLSSGNKKEQSTLLSNGRINYDIELRAFFENHANELFHMSNVLNRELSN